MYKKHVQKCVYLNKVIWLITMKVRLKVKNRSHRYDINRPRPRHEHKYTKYKMCLTSIMMVICIKQHLSNIWSSIYEKVKQHWGRVAYKKKRVHVFYKQHSDKQSQTKISPKIKKMLSHSLGWNSENDLQIKSCS